MVKGTTQRVVVVRAKGGALFDEAIFLIRPGMEQECAVTDQVVTATRSGAPPSRSCGAARRSWKTKVAASACGVARPVLGSQRFAVEADEVQQKFWPESPQSTRSADERLRAFRGTALTCHRHVIHSCAPASRPLDAIKGSLYPLRRGYGRKGKI